MTIPRKEKPYHIGFDTQNKLGGVSAAIFPYTVPEGQHGFDLPGVMTDKTRKQCRDTCSLPEMGDPCGCDVKPAFDIGVFMFHLIGRYLASGGTFVDADMCQSDNDCTGKPWSWEPPPPARAVSTLP